MKMKMKPSLAPRLTADQSKDQMLQKILTLTLEIIYLLTGEDIGARKEDSDHTYSQSPIMEPPPPFLTTEQRLLEVTNKIIELLTGEVPIRYQDVAVYLSMEEREYLEGHCDRYKAAMMEEEPPLTSPDGSRKRNPSERCIRPLYSQDSAQEELSASHQRQSCDFIVIKVEAADDGEEAYTGGDERCMQDQEVLQETTSLGARDDERVSSSSGSVNSKVPTKSEKDLPWSHVTTHGPPIQSTSANVKEEPVSCGEPLSNSDMSSFTYEAQSIKTEEEPVLCGEPLSNSDMSSFTYEAQSIKTEEEPVLCEKTLPDSGASDDLKSEAPTQPKEEPFTCREESLHHGMSPLSHHAQSAGTEMKEERLLPEEHLPHFKLDYNTQSAPTKKEPLTCQDGDFLPRTSILIRYAQSASTRGTPTYAKEEPFSCGQEELPYLDPSLLTYHAESASTQQANTQSMDFSEVSSSSLAACEALEISLDGSSDFLVGSNLSSPNEPLKHGSTMCLECGKVFPSKTELTRHQTVHTASNNFICTICGKSFAGANKLASHQRVHTGKGPYKCSECGNQFSKKANLNKHQKSHSSVRPFQCPQCNKRFLIYYNLVNHLKTHTDEKGFRCSECGRVFQQQSALLKHQKTHDDEKPLKCPECGRGFSETDELDRHRKSHSENRPQCAECGRHFVTARDLMYHQRFHTYEKKFASRLIHNSQSKKVTKSSEKSPSRSESSRLNSFCCTICGKGFSQPGRLVIHQRIHIRQRPYECSECGRWFFKEETLIRHQRHDRRPVKLTDSSETSPPSSVAPEASDAASDGAPPCPLSRAPNLRSVKEPLERGAEECRECGKVFASASKLARHQILHTRSNAFRCAVCSKGFPGADKLADHQRIHTGEGPHECAECRKRFPSKETLVKHQKVHSGLGEKRFECPQCGKRFYNRAVLVRHRRVHAEVRTLECGECGEHFSSKSLLKRHQHVHSSDRTFTCSECGKRFPLRGSLVRHLRVHSGRKPYFCSDCGKAFSYKTCLAKHQAGHAAKSPFLCPECGTGFSQESGLTAHRCRTQSAHKCLACGRSYKKPSTLQKHERSCQKIVTSSSAVV